MKEQGQHPKARDKERKKKQEMPIRYSQLSGIRGHFLSGKTSGRLLSQASLNPPSQTGKYVMNSNTPSKKTKTRATRSAPAAPIMSEIELARLGGGQVAYIKSLSPDQAKNLFPAVEGLPSGIRLFALHAADGTPIALTDSHQAALSHARDGELSIASIH